MHTHTQGLLSHVLDHWHHRDDAADSAVHAVRCGAQGQNVSAAVLCGLGADVRLPGGGGAAAAARRQRSAAAVLQDRVPQGVPLSTPKHRAVRVTHLSAFKCISSITIFVIYAFKEIMILIRNSL